MSRFRAVSVTISSLHVGEASQQVREEITEELMREAILGKRR